MSYTLFSTIAHMDVRLLHGFRYLDQILIQIVGILKLRCLASSRLFEVQKWHKYFKVQGPDPFLSL